MYIYKVFNKLIVLDLLMLGIIHYTIIQDNHFSSDNSNVTYVNT